MIVCGYTAHSVRLCGKPLSRMDRRPSEGQTSMPPLIRFLGGPLDGAERVKTAPGRWSTYLDEDGQHLRTAAVRERVRQGRSDYYVQAGAIEVDGVDIGAKYLHQVTRLAQAHNRLHVSPREVDPATGRYVEDAPSTADPTTTPTDSAIADVEDVPPTERPDQP